MMSNEPTEPLSLGTVIDLSPENGGWRDAIRDLTIRISEARQGAQSPLNLNVVFHIPGRNLKTEFEGVRTGRYSKTLNLLMVQVALTETVPADPVSHLTDAVRAAITEAEEWSRRRGHALDLDLLRDILEGA